MQCLMLSVILLAANLAAAQDSAVTDKAIRPEEMTLHVIPQSHIDIAWWWRYDPETVQVVSKRTLEMAFANLEAFPDYTFTFLQVPAIQPIENLYPELFYKIHYYLFHSAPMGAGLPNPHGTDPEKGRFKIANGMWLEADPSITSGESLVRQCLYGKRYYKYKFGLDIRSVWFQDAWTHPWTYPQILKKSGIDSYMFTRGEAGANDERMFWWEAPDGSRVFAYKPAGRGGSLSREKLLAEMSEVAKRYGVADHIALTGVGNHGGGANSKDIADMRQTMAEIPGKARFSTHTQFLAAVLGKPHNFPVVRYEISPTIRGAYTTLGEIKRKHRQSENLLLDAEKFSAIAAQLGQASYPRERLNAAWEKLMLNESHDAISGTTIPPATDDAYQLYDEILDTGTADLHRAFHAISARINTAGSGTPVVLFNPLSWDRAEVAEMELDLNQSFTEVEVVDPSGNVMPSQIVHHEVRNGGHAATVFFAARAPSFGYATYHVNPVRTVQSHANPLKATEREMENEFFRVRINPVTGCVSSVFDKRERREVLNNSQQGNLIQVIEDFGDSEGFLRSADGKIETNHRWTGKTWNVDSDPRIKVLETGPVRAVVEIKKKWELARFTQRIVLYANVPRVDFELDVDWKGKNKMVKVSFPTSLSTTEATYEIPYGNIRRPNRGEEQTALKWVDLSDRDYGVSLLNDGRNGYDVQGNVIRLSVLRSPTQPAFNTDEIGVHTLRYSLYPHRQSWQEAGTVRRGYELNNPLLPYITTAHRGDLTPAHSFLQIEPNNVIVEVFKRAEDSEHQYIVRLYEFEGKKSAVKLSWTQDMDAVHHTDLLENSAEDLATDGRSIQISVGPYSIETYKLIHDVSSSSPRWK